MLLESPNPFETKSSNKRSSVRSLLDLKMSGKSRKEAQQPSSVANGGNLLNNVKGANNDSSQKDNQLVASNFQFQSQSQLSIRLREAEKKTETKTSQAAADPTVTVTESAR